MLFMCNGLHRMAWSDEEISTLSMNIRNHDARVSVTSNGERIAIFVSLGLKLRNWNNAMTMTSGSISQLLDDMVWRILVLLASGCFRYSQLFHHSAHFIVRC